MLTEKDKEKATRVYLAALYGDSMAYISLMFMSTEQREYIKALSDELNEQPSDALKRKYLNTLAEQLQVSRKEKLL